MSEAPNILKCPSPPNANGFCGKNECVCKRVDDPKTASELCLQMQAASAGGETMSEAPNYQHGGPCCANCDHGIVVCNPIVPGVYQAEGRCSLYGFTMPAGVCDDWEED